MTARVQAWREAGAIVRIEGQKIFVREQAGTGPALLLLHGYPSSSYDWRGVFAALPGRRLIAFDFLGYGLSAKPHDHVYSLHGQADLATAIARRYTEEPIVLVAHDMGTSVTTELLARDLEGRLPIEVQGVLLFNGSMVIEKASLSRGQKLLRSRLGPLVAGLTNERGYTRAFSRLFSPLHPLSAEEAADQWALLSHDRGNRILHRLIIYLRERVAYAERWHGALRAWPGHLELAWAELDPIATGAVLDAIGQLRPHAPLTRLTGLGHYSQIEDPPRVGAVIGRFADRAAARTARVRSGTRQA